MFLVMLEFVYTECDNQVKLSPEQSIVGLCRESGPQNNTGNSQINFLLLKVVSGTMLYCPLFASSLCRRWSVTRPVSGRSIDWGQRPIRGQSTWRSLEPGKVSLFSVSWISRNPVLYNFHPADTTSCVTDNPCISPVWLFEHLSHIL